MTLTSTITSKGQVTIPAFIREELGLQPKQKVIFRKLQDKVLIKKIPNFLELEGSIKTKKEFNIKTMTKAAQKYVANRYLARTYGNGR